MNARRLRHKKHKLSRNEVFMRTTRIAIAMTALLFLVNGCSESSETEKDNGASCQSGSECRSNLCVNYTCTEPCTVFSCGEGEICLPSGICEAECSAAKPCTDGKVCEGGKCVAKVEAECSATKPCTDGKVCEGGKCVAKVEAECSAEKPCADDKICEDGKCVYECTAAKPCTGGKVCISGKCKPECDDDRPCKQNDRACIDGRCVFRPEDACTKGSCAAGTVCGEDGACFAGECSTIDACADGLFCQNAKCVTREQVVCHGDVDCGEGYGCDQNKCVPESSCSMTRTCPNNWVCHQGTCQAPVSAQCSKARACPDATQTCVENKCVTCHCAETEVCVGDGRCVDAKTSESGKVSAGDACSHETFMQHCDNNRQFSCIDGKVSVANCGARVCANAPEEGVGCYESCENDDDFIGECVGSYNFQAHFTRVCSTTDDGKRVWSLQKGYKECTTGCTNGRCNYIPADYGQQCTATSYPDKCQGDWLSYCYIGYSTGTDCKTYSKDHICALPSENAQKMFGAIDATEKLIGACALPCSEPGKTRVACVKSPEGGVVSMRYLCATSTTGQLVDFEAGYTQCTVACNVESGLCVDSI